MSGLINRSMRQLRIVTASNFSSYIYILPLTGFTKPGCVGSMCHCGYLCMEQFMATKAFRASGKIQKRCSSDFTLWYKPHCLIVIVTYSYAYFSYLSVYFVCSGFRFWIPVSVLNFWYACSYP